MEGRNETADSPTGEEPLDHDTLDGYSSAKESICREPFIDTLQRVYQVCTDGYRVLLNDDLDSEEIRERLDGEYVRLQLWGIDTGILKGKLDILQGHPLYRTTGLILLKIMRRQIRLANKYLTVDDKSKTIWLNQTAEFDLEIPICFIELHRVAGTTAERSEIQDGVPTTGETDDAQRSQTSQQKGARAPPVIVEDQSESSSDRNTQEYWAEGASGTRASVDPESVLTGPLDSVSQLGMGSKAGKIGMGHGSESSRTEYEP